MCAYAIHENAQLMLRGIRRRPSAWLGFLAGWICLGLGSGRRLVRWWVPRVGEVFWAAEVAARVFPIALYRWLRSLFLRRVLDEIVLTPRVYVQVRCDWVMALGCVVVAGFGHRLVQAWSRGLVWLVLPLGLGSAN